MKESRGCGGAAGRPALRVCAPVAAAAGLAAALAAVATGTAVVEPREDAAPDPAALRPGAADCTLAPSHFDRDGRARRDELARATRAFAASHPSAKGGTYHPVQRVPRVNYVDDEIFGKMEADRVAPAPFATDAEFLRRVTLDLTGYIPDPDTVVAFLADPSPGKRARLVDTLLASDAFVDRWGFFFGELLANTRYSSTGSVWNLGRNAWHAWFRDAVRSRKPWDVMAKEMIAGTGPNDTNPGVTWIRRQLSPSGPPQDSFDNLAAATGSNFLGYGILYCTSCHNGQGHLDAINLWGSVLKRQDFWGLSAFYARTTWTIDGTYDTSVATVGEKPSGAYALNTSTGNKTPRRSTYYTTTPAGLSEIPPAYLRTPLQPSGGAPLAGETNRQALARLVTSDPQFARAMVNRLWKELFKAGIVEPVDGFDPMRQDPSSPPPGAWTVQPTHPALLNRLAQDFAAHGYDLRYVLGVMAKSSAYQLSSFYPGTWSDAYVPYFARHFATRMLAEQIFDGIVSATGMPLGVVAMQLPDVKDPVVDLNGRLLAPFGRGDRDLIPRPTGFGLTQALNMLNNNQVTIRTHDIPGTAVHALVAANATPEQAVDTLFLRTLSRYPTPAEKALCLSKYVAGSPLSSFANHLQFVLLQKLDFLYNY